MQPTNEGIGCFARLLVDKGVPHERAYRDERIADGRDVPDVPARGKGESFSDWTARVGGVLAEGHDVVYRQPFIHAAHWPT